MTDPNLFRHLFGWFDDGNFITVETPGPCAVCGLPTDQVEINYETHLHRECEAKMDADYWRAVSDSPPRHDDGRSPLGPRPSGEPVQFAGSDNKLAPQFDSFDPEIPDGLQVEVFNYPPLAETDSKHLRDMIESGNRLWAAVKPSET